MPVMQMLSVSAPVKLSASLPFSPQDPVLRPKALNRQLKVIYLNISVQSETATTCTTILPRAITHPSMLWFFKALRVIAHYANFLLMRFRCHNIWQLSLSAVFLNYITSNEFNSRKLGNEATSWSAFQQNTSPSLSTKQRNVDAVTLTANFASWVSACTGIVEPFKLLHLATTHSQVFGA